jgi:hypothetical protein
MASTLQLSVGVKASHSTIVSQWLKFNNNSGHYVHTSQNIKSPQARFFSVCFTAPTKLKERKDFQGCKAHIKAVGPNQESMEIISLDLTHTCEKAMSRKRNYKRKTIELLSDVPKFYIPAAAGSTKQYAKMIKTSTGVTMKTAQAFKAVRSKSHDSMEAVIGQYMLFPSVVEAYKNGDSNGTYIYESVPCQWDQSLRQFNRAYLAPSFNQHFWHYAGMDMYFCDGTFTRNTGGFKHTLLIATTFDGNNEIVVLALAIVDVEDSNNWTWFKECLESDFPGSNIWMSDADKGIRSRQFHESICLSQDTFGDCFVLSRCARHLADNAKENSQGRMNDTHKQMIVELAKSRTVNVYQKRLDAIKRENEEWASYLDERKDQFVAYKFLDNGLRRFGKVTSNAVENTNSALLESRSLPIMFMVEDIMKYMREKYASRQKTSKLWTDEGRLLTEYAQLNKIKIEEEAAKREVEVLEADYPIYRGRVATTDYSNSAGFIEVTVDVEQGKAICPCRLFEEMGWLCAHASALVLALDDVPIGNTLAWTHMRYHLQTYTDSYSARIPAMAVAGKLRVDETNAPPDYRKPPGRPSMRRKERHALRESVNKRVCKACGQPGHFATTCTRPSTEHRFMTHKQKAIEWCNSLTVDLH